MRIKSLLAFVALATSAAFLGYACGGSSGGSTDIVGKCKQVCEKQKTCNPLFAAFIPDCGAFCTQNASGTSGSNTCKDPDKASAKADECLKMECSTLQTCFEQVGTICGFSTSTGTGGTTGSTGGISGNTGGISGSTGGTTGATGGNKGGSSGATGGTTGGGGTSGGGECTATCTKAYNCCVATGIVPAATCNALQGQATAACGDATMASSALSSCQQGLTTFAQLSTSPACK